MAILKEDPRYKGNNRYLFMTAVLTSREVQPFLS